MKIYTTFIRKVNEFNVLTHKNRLDQYEKLKPSPTQWEKYTKYMSLLEEDDGSFPRVSELSMRIEMDRQEKEGKRRMQEAEDRQKQKNEEAERKRKEERDRLLNVKESPETSRNKVTP